MTLYHGIVMMFLNLTSLPRIEQGDEEFDHLRFVEKGIPNDLNWRSRG
jgi:hypothetical protein